MNITISRNYSESCSARLQTVSTWNLNETMASC